MRQPTQWYFVALLALMLTNVIYVSGYVPEQSALENVVNTMEDFHRSGRSTSGLSMFEINAALREIQKRWVLIERYDLKRKNPIMHLLFDFLFVPMESYPELYNNPDLHYNNMKRFEENYKKYRPLYLGNLIDNPKAKAPKIDTLARSFLGLTGAEQVTKVMLEEARDEWRKVDKQFYEPRDLGGLYTQLKELDDILDILNRDKLFKTKRSKKAEKTPELDFEKLRSIYIDEFHKTGHFVEDGKVYKVMDD